jgi:anti-sigma B factor antagonist
MARGEIMTIEQARIDKTTVILFLDGRLDTINAPLLERKIKQWDAGISELILDFSKLQYISSMGLRVLLQAKKEFKTEGRKLVIKNMGDSVREVFEMTGFLNLMVQEEKFVVIRKLETADQGAEDEKTDVIALLLNGQMQAENVEIISKELSEIKEVHHTRIKKPSVILDMEKLAGISPEALKRLKQVVMDTDWEIGNIKARNVSADIQTTLKENGMENIL